MFFKQKGLHQKYVEGIGGTANLPQAYTDYITKSSFPYTLELDTPAEISDYLNGVYNTIVVKDIMTADGRKIDQDTG